jgi:hypothetical protein
MHHRHVSARTPLAARLVLASALLIGFGAWPVQAEPAKASGRSLAPVSLASDQAGMTSGSSRMRSSAAVSQAGSDNAEDEVNSGSRRTRSSSASN